MASIEDFTVAMRYMESAVSLGKDRRPTAEQIAVYFDLLGDLPAGLLMQSVKRALVEHQFATLPPPGLIRKHALAIASPPLAIGEAWGLVCRAATRFGIGKECEGLESLPPVVAAAARNYGWQRICDSQKGDTTTYAQFRDIYAQSSTALRLEELMPPVLRLSHLAEMISEIGLMPDERLEKQA
jgi:hypothetical protein